MSTRLTVSARTDVGRVRPKNEDAFLVADLITGPVPLEPDVTRFDVGARGALLAVSDGMGGHKAGEVAAAMTLQQLLSALATRVSTPDADKRLERAAEQANAVVYDAGKQPRLAHMGATVTALLFEGASAYLAQVGDSRAYLFRGGKVTRLTRDQNVAEAAVAAGVLRPEEAARSPLSNVLLQAIGQKSDVEVALSEVPLRQKDCVLLCSDGLTREVPDDELCELVLSATSLADARDKLVERANHHGGRDNITVVLAGVSGDMPPPQPGDVARVPIKSAPPR